MGFRIESYNLDELHRIAIPGAVVPALFWVLPIGIWRPGELDNMWVWFTRERSRCNDYGLLLVKDHRDRSKGSEINLDPVGARLRDVVPEGTERFVQPAAFSEDTRSLLVLSGGYPQPGWGVLAELRNDIRTFEELIGRVIQQLNNDEQFVEGLGVFKNATENFHRLQSLTRPSRRSDLVYSDSEFLKAEEVISFLQETQTALNKLDYRSIGQKSSEAIRRIRQVAWLNISHSTLETLQGKSTHLASAAAIRAVPPELFTADFYTKVEASLAAPDIKKSTLESLQSEELKQALKACIHLRKNRIVEPGENFQTWAEHRMTEFASILAEIIDDIKAKLVNHRGKKAQIEREYDLAMEHWRRESMEARETFHRDLAKIIELQWNIGPRFLVTFEDICRTEGLCVRSIPWDPARMVGWKLMVRQVELDVQDLQIVAQELMPDKSPGDFGNGHTVGLADGSYFTDYVNYIAISKPGTSPWIVTRNLVGRLLLPTQMKKLIRLQGETVSDTAERSELAGKLLDSFGWRQVNESQNKPLAACIKSAGDGSFLLADGISGNELRIVLESFCKDVLDVVTAQLGYDHKQLWDVIYERIPDYRPSSWRKDWDEEMRRMTAGTVSLLLPILSALAFPSRAEAGKEIASKLRKLTRILNTASHYRGEEPPPSTEFEQVPVLIHELLDKTKEFLGELPWHLHVSAVYGEQPKIVSGEAWSHGYVTPRLLRAILWTGAVPGPKVLLWNRTKRNPIITDPIFIQRPRRT